MRHIAIRMTASVTALGLAVAMFSPATAHAGFILRLTSGAESATITDGGALDANPADGAITFIGPVGVFNINVSTGISKPVFPASATFARMDLSSVNTSTAPGTLIIELTDTDFPAMPMAGDLVGRIGGTTNGSVEAAAFLNDSNAEFDTTNAEAEVHLGPFGTGAFSGTASDFRGPIGPYSMTIVTTTTHGDGTNSSSFDFELTSTALPVPASLALVITAVPALGLGAWLRRRKVSMSS